ncbi:MAG: hypothetical protein QXW91_03085, partial [Candidatus Nitrosotenuis sp.]
MKAIKMRVLIINDFASNAYTFQKYLEHEISVLYFNKHEVITEVKNPLYFSNENIFFKIQMIKKLSKDFDLFLVMGWLAAAICYLAEVKYIMYFTDSYIDPEHRIRKKMSYVKKLFLSKLFKDTLQSAIGVVAGGEHNTMMLRKYRKDARYILPIIDREFFTPNAKKIPIKENLFVFLCPQRIDEVKGQHIIW